MKPRNDLEIGDELQSFTGFWLEFLLRIQQTVGLSLQCACLWRWLVCLLAAFVIVLAFFCCREIGQLLGDKPMGWTSLHSVIDLQRNGRYNNSQGSMVCIRIPALPLHKALKS